MKAKILSLSGLITSITPLGIVVGINWNKYISTEAKAWGMTIGGVILLIILVLQFLGKAKAVFGSGYVALVTVFILVVALQPLLAEMQLILGMLLAGQSINKFVFVPLSNRAGKKQDRREQADVTSKAIQEVIKYRGRI